MRAGHPQLRSVHLLRYAFPAAGTRQAVAVSWRIIGCGAPMRGDDEAGLMVARQLSEWGLNAEEHSRDGLALLECWRDGEPTILIDATASGAQPVRSCPSTEPSRFQ
jgi:hypothetical protein